MSDMEEQQHYERLEYVEGEQLSDVVLEDDLDAHPRRHNYNELTTEHDPAGTDLYTSYSSSRASAGYDNELLSGIGSKYHYDQHQSAQLHDENSNDNNANNDDSGYRFQEKTTHETIENQHFEHNESLAEHHYDESKASAEERNGASMKTRSYLDDDEDVVKTTRSFVHVDDNNETLKTDSTLPELGGRYSFHSNKESDERDTYNFTNNIHEEDRFNAHEPDYNRHKSYGENKLDDTNGNDENQRHYGYEKDRNENIENVSRLSDNDRSTTPKHDSIGDISSKLDKYGKIVETSNSGQTPRSRIEDNEMPTKGKVSSLKSLFETNAVHNSDANKRASYKYEYGVGKSTGLVNKGVFQ